nr:hypothetical protein [uncultured Carboxylicivirga sp.]
MKDTLIQLEILVESFCSNPSHPNCCQLKERIYSLCQISKKNFSRNTLDTASPRALKVLVTTYQYNLIKILDDLNEIELQSPLNIKENKCYGKVCNYLLSQISFLKIKYRCFFDHNAYVPNIELTILKSILETKISTIKKHLQNIGFLQHIDMILHPLVVFISQKNRSSYYQLKFLFNYTKNLLNYQTPIFFEEIEEAIKILITNNINTNESLNFIILELDKITSKEPNKLVCLYRIQKIIKQFKPIQKYRFIKKNKTLKKNLSNWIEHEIQYQKTITNNPQNLSILLPDKVSIKVKCNLSVAQIAYFANLLDKSNIINTNSKEDLFRFFSANFSSKNIPDFSVNSFRNHFFKPQLATKNSIRKILLTILKSI